MWLVLLTLMIEIASKQKNIFVALARVFATMVLFSWVGIHGVVYWIHGRPLLTVATLEPETLEDIQILVCTQVSEIAPYFEYCCACGGQGCPGSFYISR